MTTFEEILFDTVYRSCVDRMNQLPPPPEGYRYAYDFPQMTYNRETNCWDVTVDLCLEDGDGRKIRITGDKYE